MFILGILSPSTNASADPQSPPVLQNVLAPSNSYYQPTGQPLASDNPRRLVVSRRPFPLCDASCIHVYRTLLDYLFIGEAEAGKRWKITPVTD